MHLRKFFYDKRPPIEFCVIQRVKDMRKGRPC